MKNISKSFSALALALGLSLLGGCAATNAVNDGGTQEVVTQRTENGGLLVHFVLNSTEFVGNYDRNIEEFVNFLKENPQANITIQGHACNLGTEAHNMVLSKRRAETVRNLLVKKGIAKKRVKVEAYGYSRPMASNDTEEGRAQNRRVEVVVAQ